MDGLQHFGTTTTTMKKKSIRRAKFHLGSIYKRRANFAIYSIDDAQNILYIPYSIYTVCVCMCEGNLVLLTPSGQKEAKQFAGVGRRQTNTYTTTTATARQAERGRADGRR